MILAIGNHSSQMSGQSDRYVSLFCDCHRFLVLFPKIGGPRKGPPNTTVLIFGTPKKVPLILGNYHLSVVAKGASFGIPACQRLLSRLIWASVKELKFKHYSQGNPIIDVVYPYDGNLI